MMFLACRLQWHCRSGWQQMRPEAQFNADHMIIDLSCMIMLTQHSCISSTIAVVGCGDISHARQIMYTG